MVDWEEAMKEANKEQLNLGGENSEEVQR